MKLTQLSDEIAYKAGVNRISQLLIAILSVTTVLLAFTTATADRTHRETIVPPIINKTFWVDGDKVSPEYIEQMGWFALQLALNNSPVGAENNARMLLKYAAPASYGDLERVLMGNVKRLRENNTSTMFSARSVTVNEHDNSVVFAGVMTTYISDKRVAEVSQAYIVRFGYSAGRIYILDLRETDPKEPFKEPPKDQQPSLNAEPASN